MIFAFQTNLKSCCQSYTFWAPRDNSWWLMRQARWLCLKPSPVLYANFESIQYLSIFSKVSIYRQSICHIDISNRATQTNDLPTKDPGNPPSLPIQGPLIAFSWLDSWLGKEQPWAKANAHLLKRLQKTQRSSKWTALSLSGTIVQPLCQPTISLNRWNEILT